MISRHVYLFPNLGGSTFLHLFNDPQVSNNFGGAGL